MTDDVDWKKLRDLDMAVRDLVQEGIKDAYASLQRGSSTPGKLRHLESSFAYSILPPVLDMLVRGLTEIIPSLEISLVVGHCRGLTLHEYIERSSPGSKRKYIAEQSQTVSKPIGHITTIRASYHALPAHLRTNNVEEDSIRACIYHRILFLLYRSLFDKSQTLNYLMLDKAPKKNRLEIHLGCDHPTHSNGNILGFRREDMDKLFPTAMLQYIAEIADRYFPEFLSNYNNMLTIQQREIELAQDFRKDTTIKNLRQQLKECRSHYMPSPGEEEAHQYLNRMLGSEDGIPWIGKDTALTTIQALAFYRKLGGQHFYTFPTSSAEAIGAGGRSVPSSSVVIMSKHHISDALQFYVSGLTQAIYDAKEAFTVGVLHEEATLMTLVNASMHQVDKKLMEICCRLEVAQVDRSLCEHVGMFTAYLLQSIRLVNAMNSRSIDDTEVVSLRDAITWAAQYAELAQHGIELDYNDLQISALRADKYFIYLLFYNLLHNACAHMGDKSNKKVVIKSARKDQYVEIHISNNGKPYEDLSLFYEPRTGFGTRISLWVAELHGGTIEPDLAWHSQGKGAAVVVRLPIHRAFNYRRIKQ